MTFLGGTPALSSRTGKAVPFINLLCFRAYEKEAASVKDGT